MVKMPGQIFIEVCFRRASFRHSWRDNLFLVCYTLRSLRTLLKIIVKEQIQIGRVSNIYVLSYYPNRLANFYYIF